MVYNQARETESYNFYIFPVLDRISYGITSEFAAAWADPSAHSQLCRGQCLFPISASDQPWYFIYITEYAPFDPPTAIPTITVGLIYLVIIAYFSFTFFIPTHMKHILPNPAAPYLPLKFIQLNVYHWCSTIAAYFFLALSYSLDGLAFRI